MLLPGIWFLIGVNKGKPNGKDYGTGNGKSTDAGGIGGRYRVWGIGFWFLIGIA